MKLITTYYGFEIYLDDWGERGEFQATRGSENNTLLADTFIKVKALIDEFVAANKGFEPLQLQHFTYDYLLPDPEFYTVVGVDKYGRFIIEGEEDGKKYRDEVVPSEEVAYIIPDERNEAIAEQIQALEAQQQVLQQQMEALHKTFHRKSLADVRAELGIADSLKSVN
jgi:hypothetical protein